MEPTLNHFLILAAFAVFLLLAFSIVLGKYLNLKDIERENKRLADCNKKLCDECKRLKEEKNRLNGIIDEYRKIIHKIAIS